MSVLGQPESVQNQGYFSISMMVAPANALTPLSCLLRRLNDDLFGILNLIHHQPELLVICLQYDNVDDIIGRDAFFVLGTQRTRR